MERSQSAHQQPTRVTAIDENDGARAARGGLSWAKPKRRRNSFPPRALCAARRTADENDGARAARGGLSWVKPKRRRNSFAPRTLRAAPRPVLDETKAPTKQHSPGAAQQGVPLNTTTAPPPLAGGLENC